MSAFSVDPPMRSRLLPKTGLPDARVWLLLLILFGFILRLASIDFQSLWRDEVDAIRFGRDLATGLNSALAGGGLNGLAEQLRQSLTQPGFNGPLYFLALAQWSNLAGYTGYALRLFSACFGVLAIPLTYVLAKRLVATRMRADGLDSSRGFSAPTFAQPQDAVCVAAAWLTAISPYFVWYSQEAKMYAEITTLALLAIYALRRAVETPPGQRAWPWWATVVAATTLALYSHIFSALLIGVELALFALWWPLSRRHLRGGAIALAALTLPYLPLIAWQVRLALTPGDQGFRFYSFGEILRVMQSGFTHGVLPFDYALSRLGVTWSLDAFRPEVSPANWGVWLTSALVIAGVLLWRDSRDRIARIGLAAWIMLPAAAIALVSLNRPVFTDRYLIWIGPAVYLLAALGIHDVWRFRRWLGLAALALVSAMALLGVWTQATTPFKSDFRAAARYVEQRYQGEPILFQIPHGQYAFDYYFGLAFPILEGPYTNFRNPDGSYQHDAAFYDALIASQVRGHAALWLVASEVEMWDDRYLLENWLNEHARRLDRADFTRVTVVRYALEP